MSRLVSDGDQGSPEIVVPDSAGIERDELVSGVTEL
jgi:hypothetical protein